MTDPGRRPPASVWLLVLILLTPGAGVLGYAAGANPDAACVGGMLLGLVAPAVVGLLRGAHGGLVLADTVVWFVGGCCGLVTLVTLVDGDWPAVARSLTPCGWLASVVGLRLWPETRRWCGVLPPDDSEEGE